MDRFWSKVQKSEGCWLWTGAKDPNGYGRFSVGRRMRLSHRIAYELTTGEPIASGMNACHRCDNPSCVNPAHLFIGTQADNVHDMQAKGRTGYSGSRGSKHPMAKLTESDVVAIRADKRSQTAIAADYGVSQSAIHLIKSRKEWKHVPEVAA